MKSLLKLKTGWDKLATIDPLWSILAYSKRLGNRWDESAFFTTGKNEIKELFSTLKKMNVDFDNEVALDFGCGVGRTTFPLGDYFKLVYGVDISKKMIELANIYNKKDNIKFVLNDSEYLKIFKDDSLNFIYTNIVLQHIPNRLTLNYLKEFNRILCEGGVLVFQMPDRMVNTTLDIFWNNIITHKIIYPIFLKFRTKNKSLMELHPIRRKNIIRFLKKSKFEILGMIENKNSGPRWVSYTYIVKKQKSFYSFLKRLR